ncbi:unnamed protein product [Urochloa humidicola]
MNEPNRINFSRTSTHAENMNDMQAISFGSRAHGKASKIWADLGRGDPGAPIPPAEAATTGTGSAGAGRAAGRKSRDGARSPSGDAAGAGSPAQPATTESTGA